jgi:hypothetical protein
MNLLLITDVFLVMLVCYLNWVGKFESGKYLVMKQSRFIKSLILICVFVSATCGVFAQEKSNSPIKSQEVSESDGVPVLIKHLPDWENARNRAAYILNASDLRKALGERQVFDLIDFAGGTEAVTAPFPQGKLLIVEYAAPQSSIEADNKITQRLTEIAQNSQTVYRRIGNYNAFVFDTTDEAAANGLLDQIKYEKTVQWLGSDPYAFKRAERAFIETTSSLFLSTVKAIVGGLGLSVLVGLGVGLVFYRMREQKRSNTEAFSDAGGMTRLNLDGLTKQTSANRLLGD